jgi:hypothetical protein
LLAAGENRRGVVDVAQGDLRIAVAGIQVDRLAEAARGVAVAALRAADQAQVVPGFVDAAGAAARGAASGARRSAYCRPRK